MPIKVDRYTCAFKCGTKGKPLNTMIKHEAACIKNPSNKTCETCTNRVYESDSDDFRSWFMRGCALTVMNEFIESIHDDLELKFGVGHIKPLFNCPNWCSKLLSDETNDYINNVRSKIEAKKVQLQDDNLPF